MRSKRVGCAILYNLNTGEAPSQRARGVQHCETPAAFLNILTRVEGGVHKMAYEIISGREFAGLPPEPDAKFAALEEICRRNMNAMITGETPEHYDQGIRTQYMAIIAAAAQELGFVGFGYPSDMQNPMQEFDDFLLRATATTTRIRLRSTSGSPEASVRLASKTRGRIEQQIQKLRQIISASELPEARRKGLLRKLDELSVELSQPRLSFAKVLAVLAAVSVGVGGATGFLAEAPQAIATITSLVGADKEAEDAEAARLGPPVTPQALPAPAKQIAAPARTRRELEDEIPF
ncbi:hypothetical protein JQK88_33190 [Mesorhizobium caraganae]|uniref:hypothetical protein n=1 Tax=Mesorhizobium caraganae TaxID=483206 RepID=UPI001939CAD3|nr:hypothetical protein [Mesorhizobium caraganae]MBM2715966.1 hypothetical protein [Mesorhizobium caraganae]